MPGHRRRRLPGLDPTLGRSLGFAGISRYRILIIGVTRGESAPEPPVYVIPAEQTEAVRRTDGSDVTAGATRGVSPWMKAMKWDFRSARKPLNLYYVTYVPSAPRARRNPSSSPGASVPFWVNVQRQPPAVLVPAFDALLCRAKSKAVSAHLTSEQILPLQSNAMCVLSASVLEAVGLNL